MKFNWIFVALVIAMFGARQAMADVPVYESCTDAAGRTMPAEMDVNLTKVVQVAVEKGQPVIRYNPNVLPRLSAKGRLFFFAHECAQVSLGAAGRGGRALARAQQADCLGLATLLSAGQVEEPAGIQALQSELVFSDDEWALLPGPQRTFDLAACPKRTALRLPAATLPAAQQAGWDTCVRVCGDKLRACQTACQGANCVAGCVSTYGRCEAKCEPR